MKFYIEQLDRRHNGHELWKYRLRISHGPVPGKSQLRNFHMLRTWMLENYGVSCERDNYSETVIELHGYELFNPPWCWHIDRDYPNTPYIYIKNQEILSYITLKWV